MPNKPEVKLTSEQRCRTAFKERWGSEPISEQDHRAWVYHMEGWMSCWRYLESRVTEFVET
jgi:hypothetical protein